jgi:hypothetical protein
MKIYQKHMLVSVLAPFVSISIIFLDLDLWPIILILFGFGILFALVIYLIEIWCETK